MSAIRSRRATMYRVHAQDGSILNHSACGTDDASRAEWVARTYGPDASIIPHEYDAPLSACDNVLENAIDAGEVLAEDRTVMHLAMTHALHMAYDAGRPSDAMRSAVWEYKNVGRDEFIRRMSVRP